MKKTQLLAEVVLLFVFRKSENLTRIVNFTAGFLSKDRHCPSDNLLTNFMLMLNQFKLQCLSVVLAKFRVGKFEALVAEGAT